MDHRKLWKILKVMRIPDHLTCLLRSLYAVQETTGPNMGKFTGSYLGEEYHKAVYCYSTYLTFMQSTSCEMRGWMNKNMGSKLLGEISNNLRFADNTTLMAESKEELNSLFMKVKEESIKADSKLNIQ